MSEEAAEPSEDTSEAEEAEEDTSSGSETASSDEEGWVDGEDDDEWEIGNKHPERPTIPIQPLIRVGQIGD